MEENWGFGSYAGAFILLFMAALFAGFIIAGLFPAIGPIWPIVGGLAFMYFLAWVTGGRKRLGIFLLLLAGLCAAAAFLWMVGG